MATIDIRSKDTIHAIIAAIEGEIAPLEARKAELAQKRIVIDAETTQIDRDLERWRPALAAANQALALLFEREPTASPVQAARSKKA